MSEADMAIGYANTGLIEHQNVCFARMLPTLDWVASELACLCYPSLTDYFSTGV